MTGAHIIMPSQQTKDGDVFEIEADAFLFPLRNKLGTAKADAVNVQPL